MQFLSDILIKGKAFIDNIVTANGSPFKFLVRDNETGEVKEKDISIPSSQGQENVVNVSDGSGNFKQTHLEINGDIIRSQYKTQGYDSEIALYDDGIMIQKANTIEVIADHAELRKRDNSEYSPTTDRCLVTKKYVDDKTEQTPQPHYYSEFSQPGTAHPGDPINPFQSAVLNFSDHNIGIVNQIVKPGGYFCKFNLFILGNKMIHGGAIHVAQHLKLSFVTYVTEGYRAIYISDLKTEITGTYCNTYVQDPFNASEDMFPILLTKSGIKLENNFSLWGHNLPVYLKYNFLIDHFHTNPQ
jgi:hypothetical protein